MKRPALFLLLVACARIGSPENPAPPQAPPLAENERVVEVADGDSFRTEISEVRLLGINAPELDECFGDEAADWLTELLEGKPVTVTPHGTDQFDRVLAIASVEGVNLNLEAVHTGHALALSEGLDDIEGLAQAQAASRADGVGLWGEQICGAVGPVVDLSITEVHFNPPGNDEIELVEVTNSGPVAVELAGFRLRDESSVNRFEFPAYRLAPGDSVTISTGCETAQDLLAWCTTDPVWNNGGDTVLLLDNFGRVVAFERY